MKVEEGREAERQNRFLSILVAATLLLPGVLRWHESERE